MIIGVAAVPDGGVCRAWYAPARAPTATYPSCVLNRTVNTQCQSCVGVDHSVKHSELSESITKGISLLCKVGAHPQLIKRLRREKSGCEEPRSEQRPLVCTADQHSDGQISEVCHACFHSGASLATASVRPMRKRWISRANLRVGLTQKNNEPTMNSHTAGVSYFLYRNSTDPTRKQMAAPKSTAVCATS
jgi:hypothetical protein